jgi:hypothetical protein
MAYKYCVAENWGKDFININEARLFRPSGFPGNIWQIPENNKDANFWVHRVAGTFKTKVEAQTIINAAISEAQTTYDAETETLKTQEPYVSLTAEEKTQNDTQRANQRPQFITLPE